MTKRFLGSINVLAAAVVVALLAGPWAGSSFAGFAGDEQTEDIVHMEDGRELHGQIIEEKRDAIVFELVVRGSSIRTKVTLLLDEIAKIERDVPLADAPEASAQKPAKKRGATSRPDDEDRKVTYGSRRAASHSEDVPSFYLVHMKGQMGTDVVTDVYEGIVDDIRAHDPDILLIEMDCYDEEDLLYSMLGTEERGIADFDEFRKLIKLFRNDLGDIRQVLWIHDSVGPSSIVALAWDELYMKSDARFGGLKAVRDTIGFEKWSDEDVRGKMTAAFMSFVKGFLAHGGYSEELADAMVRPSFSLSGRWKGRDVTWTLDTTGDYVVDNDKDATAEFRAKDAEDLCISDGTVETLDDLALLLGFREYHVAEAKGVSDHEDYKEDWRRALDNCKTWLQDYDQNMGWANGDDAMQYLGRAKKNLEQVIAAMERYSAVELRLGRELGIRKFDLITTLEQLKERLRAMRQSQRGGRGGRGAGGGGG